jgi:hypothetical protein
MSPRVLGRAEPIAPESGMIITQAAVTPAVAERAGQRLPGGERAEIQAADRRAPAALGEHSAQRERVAESLLRCPRESSRGDH